MRDGAHVLIADLDEPVDLAREAAFLCTDVTSPLDVDAMVANAVERWGRLDILVNNAGMASFCDTENLDEIHWDRVFAVNVKSVFLCCKAAITVMREQGGGSIINVASISGLAGDYALDAYNASKGAVVNYTRNLAVTYARKGIRVNAVCPGLVLTQMTLPTINDPEERDHWLDRIPIRRGAEPEEIASVIAFLASPEASYMAGAIVPVDGGVMAHTGQPNMPQRIQLRQERAHMSDAMRAD
jgi:meso-butanediol dehydrogenase/(S,S)-butanediol dehydrogenase/diacetyl reductase